MTQITTTAAPPAVGPYSQARAHRGLLYVSGQLPLDPALGTFASDDPVQQLRQCLANIAAIARAAGTSLDRTLKTTVLVTDLGAFAAMNAAYGEMFSAPYPARATYQVAALPLGAKVEIEAVIALD
jgi:2-iminobutanoate/2-iminopropanoate deaminase